MTTKVGELAKELKMENKELIKRAGTLGIEVKMATSNLTEGEVELIRKEISSKETASEDGNKKGKATGVSKKGNLPPGRPLPKSEMSTPPGKPMPKEASIKLTTEAEQEKEEKSKAAEEKTANFSDVKKEEKIIKKNESKIDEKKENKVATKEVKEESPKQVKQETQQEAKKEDKKDNKKEVKKERIKEPKKEVHKEFKKDSKKDVEKEVAKEKGEKKSQEKVQTKKDDFKGENPRKKVHNKKKDQPARSSGEEKNTNKKEEQSRGTNNNSNNRKNKNTGKSGQQGVRSLEKRVKKKYKAPKPVEAPVEEVEELPVGTKVINVPITIAGFAEQAGVSVSNIIMTLLKMGVVANQNQNIDEVTVETLADEMGLQVVIGKVHEEEEEDGLELFEDREKDLEPRPPIITVMGHVDHGKTSLLDAIRDTRVTDKESGGITQHIGASEVEVNGQKIVFLDTPGHEAFTAMRARGADITDIAILVVAADDSVKPQTIESISHAKAAGVPIIVAVNKIDKPGANPDRVKQDLTEHGIVVEEWGGDVISVPVSAKTGEGIVNLLEMVLLQAEVLELKANKNRHAMGTVIEARLDKAKGPIASLLITNGTLKAGQSIVAGTCYGRIRLMINDKGETIRKAGPATAVEILGLTDVPAAGDKFNAVGEDRMAREIAEKRKSRQREEVMAKTSGTSLEELFTQIQDGEAKELNIIVKADVGGSVGAVNASLEKLSNENVKVRIIHSGVGTITESDIALAETSGAIVIGFNVRPSIAVSTKADREGIEIRTYRVIYDIIDDIENAMKGMLDPEFKEEILGTVEVRNTFKVPGVGIIAGAYVTDGKILRNASVRLVRDGIVIHEGTISSLKRFKDDAKEVAQGFECGIGIENYNDVKDGDVIECFHMVEIERE